MLDVRRLRLLREVAARGSLSGAAEALSFTQPAISHQIAKLEQETGATLVERIPRGVRLTDAGLLLVRHADAVLSRLELAESDLEELLALRRGRLRLGAFPSSFIQLVSRSLARLRELHPGIDVTLAEISLEDSAAQLEAGGLDLAVAFEYGAPSPEPDGGPSRGHLLDDPMYLVLGADHPLASRSKIRLRDLADEQWLQYTQGPASKVHYNAFLRAGYEPRIALETDDLLAIQGLVAAGAGVTALPGMALPTLRPDLAVRSLGDDLPTRSVFALWPRTHRSLAAEAMLGVLTEQAPLLRSELDKLAEPVPRPVP